MKRRFSRDVQISHLKKNLCVAVVKVDSGATGIKFDTPRKVPNSSLESTRFFEGLSELVV